MARRKPKPANNDEPTCSFRFMRQTWQRIAWACRKSGFIIIADSIENHIKDVRHTDLVEIVIPISACIGISQACMTHEFGVGIAFATAASSHHVEKVLEETVSSEALANAKEELEEMESIATKSTAKSRRSD